jgi:hypothetical protein
MTATTGHSRLAAFSLHIERSGDAGRTFGREFANRVRRR